MDTLPAEPQGKPGLGRKRLKPRCDSERILARPLMSLKTNCQLEEFHDVYGLTNSSTFIQLLTGSILEIVARGLMTDFSGAAAGSCYQLTTLHIVVSLLNGDVEGIHP